MSAERWWIAEAPVTFTWDLWYACNYRCSYCWWEMGGLWETLAKQHKLLPPAEWDAVWTRIYDRCGEARIEVLGGEPLLYPKFGELLRLLSAKHRLQVTTNLSPEPAQLERLLDPLSPERVHFNASFHPQFIGLQPFLERTQVLQDRGFDPGVLFVTWPPLLPRLEEYRREFVSRGYPFSAMIFQGDWEGRTYPEAFTPAEKAMIEGVMNHPTLKSAEVRYRLDRDAVIGKLCHAGRVYANVKANGDVYRCGQDAFGRRPMGNLFDPGFELLDAPKPCPYRQCSCLEFKYLDELLQAPQAAA
ncbi:MAG: radical SAM protein [Elusimicrobia bacterium]|nr:radical SAM protein [Elusimicrobiota bacterium]